ncbi:DNA polymerase-3 subunit epsilon [Microlunatus sagamiharensis]|uniref:DNA polymerase-3 subunit epsilon n=1 Tax=Microlunatus sagamiharensis TaxID=546874 RepID=A0A1H2MQT6_9ACTN|nr:DEDD exonuclease domain-containing protein [Microlunatus sagamiharensis]SDU95577.1 DNA polymerase-3 subunit epsilon [Microlunatus sagamiharensis]
MTTAPAQASFDDLGTLLSDLTYVVVDLETTGGAESDRITEIGAVKVRGGEVLGEFQTLVNPRTDVPPLIAVLTGITNAMVAGAPTLREVLPAFLAFAQGCVVVAHNAPFDTGFLRRACEGLGYAYPRWPVLDTATLARVILVRDEVPNCKLGTLARHFRTAVTPNHRALTDAQATVDVLHGLMERVGNLGVHTLEDLQEFSRQVSPQRRARRTWARDVPEVPGVYLFVAEHEAGTGTPGGEAQRHVLYVGKSKNLRARVRTYFTAAEKRRRIDEMVRLATGVETIPCLTTLQADVLELRLIAAHAPRYNRRSKFPERTSWVKITDEAFPRLSIVTGVRDDGATYFGPFPRRQAAEDVVLAVYDGFPLRQCTARLSATRPTAACALAGMRRCCAPCDGSVGREEYAALVEEVRSALVSDPRPAVRAVSTRLTRLVAEHRFEEAETIRRRLEALTRTARRFHRIASLAACPEIVAARREGDGWDIHVIRHGRLAATGVASRHEVPQAVARSTVATAETVRPASGPLPAAGIEETEQIADWLEQPGVRLMHIDGDWAWPLHAVLDHESFVHHALGGAGPVTSTDVVEDRRLEAVGPGGA